MAKKEKKEEETKEEVKKKTAPKKTVKQEKIPLIRLFIESTYRQSMMLGAFEYNGLLKEFTEDLFNETENCELTKDEFEEMIKKYLNRSI